MITSDLLNCRKLVGSEVVLFKLLEPNLVWSKLMASNLVGLKPVGFKLVGFRLVLFEKVVRSKQVDSKLVWVKELRSKLVGSEVRELLKELFLQDYLSLESL